MQDLIKRLELLRQSFALGDGELVALQCKRLEAADLPTDDHQLAAFMEQLQAQRYGEAVRLLEAYLSQHSGVVKYRDPEIEALRLELQQLELRWQQLTTEKGTLEDFFERFELELQLQLGRLFERIAAQKHTIARWLVDRARRLWQAAIAKRERKRKKAERKRDKWQKRWQKEQRQQAQSSEQHTKSNGAASQQQAANPSDQAQDQKAQTEREPQSKKQPKRKRSKAEKKYRKWKKRTNKTRQQQQSKSEKQAQEEYQKAQQEEQQSQQEKEDFHQEYQQAKANSQKLNPEEEKELKTYYKKACQLCHPDRVDEKHKDKATQLMQKLNEAKKQKDLATIKEVYQLLKSGEAFGGEISAANIDDKKTLKEKITNLHAANQRLQREIDTLKQDGNFETVSQPELWEAYFSAMKNQLESEIERLEKEFADLQSEENPTTKRSA